MVAATRTALLPMCKSEIQTGQSIGLFSVIDEPGDAVHGYIQDPYGRLVIAANRTGSAGALFWEMSNGNQPASFFTMRVPALQLGVPAR